MCSGVEVLALDLPGISFWRLISAYVVVSAYVGEKGIAAALRRHEDECGDTSSLLVRMYSVQQNETSSKRTTRAGINKERSI